MTISSDLPKPCFPSCFNWQPVTYALDSQLPKEGYRRKTENFREIYGTIDWKKDRKTPVSSSRHKFLEIVLLQPIVAAVRVPYRIVSLFLGDFVHPGVENGTYEWQLKRQEWSLRGKDISQLPSTGALRVAIAKGVATEFLKNVGKIVLYVIMLIPLELIAIYGLLCNPYDADVPFGFIENLCARNWIPLNEAWPKWKCLQIKISDYIAPCKQINGVLIEKNIYRAMNDYNPGSYRSKLCVIDRTLGRKQVFFEREGIEVDRILKWIEYCRKSLYDLSSCDGDEFRPSYNARKENQRKELFTLLQQLQDGLAKVEAARETLIAGKIGQKRRLDGSPVEAAKTQILTTLRGFNKLLTIPKEVAYPSN